MNNQFQYCSMTVSPCKYNFAFPIQGDLLDYSQSTVHTKNGVEQRLPEPSTSKRC